MPDSPSRPFRSVSTVAEGLLSPLLPRRPRRRTLYSRPKVVRDRRKMFKRPLLLLHSAFSNEPRSERRLRSPLKFLRPDFRTALFPIAVQNGGKKTQEAIERLKLAFRRRSLFPCVFGRGCPSPIPSTHPEIKLSPRR